MVLSGGGALGAYEVGVLRTLEDVGLRPHIVSGASVGALNAVAWVAQGFRARALEGVWSQIDPAAIGVRWTSIGWRVAGAILLVVGLAEMILTWGGSIELGAAGVFWREAASRAGFPSSVLDLVAWGVVALLGLGMLRTAGRADALLARLGAPPTARRIRLAAAAGLVLWGIAHLLTWALAIPWPHRFSATLLLTACAFWVINHPGRIGRRARRFLFRLLPESSRPGLWGEAARRSLLERMLAGTSRTGLIGDDPHLIVVALDLESGRVAHFVNGADPAPGFRARVESGLGEVVRLEHPDEVLAAAVASSAIPIVFEPGVVRRRRYVDSVAFATHPLRAAVYAGADAAIVVRVAPSETPPALKPFRHPADIWGRFLDLASWRDLQQELRALPSDWTRTAPPRPLCVVEPEEALPWGVLSYSPRVSKPLMARGAVDARRTLERAGWLAPRSGS